RTRSGLLAEVAKLEAQALSTAGPDGAPQLLLQLRALEERAGVLQADVAEAERRGREDEAREKQETEWKARVTAAKSDLRDRQQALAEAQARRGPIEEALKTTEDALKSADKKDKKDLNARRRKLSDDIQRVKKDVTRLEGEIAALEQRIAETFEFRPPAPRGRRSQPGRRFVPPASKERPPAQVPDEALPEVGALRSHKGARYLVIHAWEELAAGEKTAARLSAKLVAPEDV
ncbi:MAG: hypothetical protein R3A79_22655, partial [Nannocystaceae bacterium]